MAFLHKNRDLPKLMLCGNQLPWVNSGKHLGNRITNNPVDMITQDTKEKRAHYIQRNNELMQEFAFAHSSTKTKINAIFNSHFTGSVLWDLGHPETEKVYNTWNTSIRKMFRLNMRTHRYFIEPLSQVQHIKIALMKRFLKFTNALSCCPKNTARNLFNTIKHDCRSITGRNLRQIMLFCGRAQVSETTIKDVTKMKYQATTEKNTRRIHFVKDLLDIRDNISEGDDWNKTEIQHCIDFLCTT